MFSVESVPRNYERAQSEELEEYEGVQRSTRSTEEYNGVQLEVRIIPMECLIGR
jgi:hypothetical protein